MTVPGTVHITNSSAEDAFDEPVEAVGAAEKDEQRETVVSAETAEEF
ncbi:hypothetical protein [Halosimplex salinum]|nr:hypothetical protein [Halosimplex salinum]